MQGRKKSSKHQYVSHFHFNCLLKYFQFSKGKGSKTQIKAEHLTPRNTLKVHSQEIFQHHQGFLPTTAVQWLFRESYQTPIRNIWFNQSFLKSYLRRQTKYGRASSSDRTFCSAANIFQVASQVHLGLWLPPPLVEEFHLIFLGYKIKI